ncbi:potassium channel family protein [Humibacillus xanthopallidus]
MFHDPPRMLDRFELVLLFVLATIAVQGLVDVRGSVFAELFAHAITGLALVAAVRASGTRRRWRRAADVLVVVILVISVATVTWRREEGTLAVPPETTWLIAAAITPVLIARRVLQHTVVTLQTIMGSVAAYLQIAVAYAFLFQTIDAFTSSQPFFGKEVSTTVYMYFSLVTISTVGFGDFVAVTSLGRLASGSEAVIGQVFLVTFVALIVSRFAAAMPLGRGARGQAQPDEPEPPRTLQEAMSPTQSEPPPPPDPDRPEHANRPDPSDRPGSGALGGG